MHHVLSMSFALLLISATAAAESVKVHYLGNSLTAGTAPKFHEHLGKSKGDTWDAVQFGIAGGRLHQYTKLLFPKYPDMAYPEPTGRPQKNALRTRQRIENETYDAIVIQPHQFHLIQFANWMEREAGDIEDGGRLVKWIRQHQPEAQLYLFQTWTSPQYEDSQEDPIWETFDYETYWLRPYSNPPPENDPFPSRVMRTQDYFRQLREALNANHADILGDQPIRMIPIGDVMLEIDRRLKAGTLVDSDGKPFTLIRRTVIVDNETDKNLVDIKREEIPFDSITLFYQDFQHQNPGLPRFFDASVFYATLFGKSPKGLDFTPYNEYPKKNEDYEIVKESAYNWKAGDNRHHIEVTEELADALAEITWQVVSSHPYTGLSSD
jgi:hypothetical protein